MALHDIESRIGGELALIFNQYKVTRFSDDDDGCGEPNAGNAGQVRQLASQFWLGGEQVGQVLVKRFELVRNELLLRA